MVSNGDGSNNNIIHLGIQSNAVVKTNQNFYLPHLSAWEKGNEGCGSLPLAPSHY